MLKYKDETIGIGKVDLSDVDYAYDNGFVSRNLFDEQMEIGGIDITSGASVTYATRMRSVNYTEIDSTKSYYICTQSTVSTSATKLRIFYYNSSKTFISYQDWTNTLTIPSGAKYIRFITIDGYGTTYNNDIILNVSDSKNGIYQPYAMSNVELTKLVNDDLRMLGWTVPSECPIQNYTDGNGVFHQRVGRVDLGTLSWSVNSQNNFYSTEISDINTHTSTENYIYCSKYEYNSKAFGGSATTNCICQNSKRIWIIDSNYTDATAFKSAMSGVYLYYELTTEVTKSVDGNEALTNKFKYSINKVAIGEWINGETLYRKTYSISGTFKNGDFIHTDTELIDKNIVNIEGALMQNNNQFTPVAYYQSGYSRGLLINQGNLGKIMLIAESNATILKANLTVYFTT